MREFKEPYYTGPECVCCKEPSVETERAEIVAMLDQERREWGLGTLAEKIISRLITRIQMRSSNE